MLWSCYGKGGNFGANVYSFGPFNPDSYMSFRAIGITYMEYLKLLRWVVLLRQSLLLFLSPPCPYLLGDR